MILSAWERGPIMPKRTIREIIEESEQRLLAARFGLEDMKKPERLRTGLANVIAFGRMITFGLQHLRGVVLEFDKWYEPKKEAMMSDPLMKYFYEQRNKIEKEAKPVPLGVVWTNLRPIRFPQDFGDPPPGATGVFIGDQNGGAGWTVGTEGEKYYIDLPEEKMSAKAFLIGAPKIPGNPNATAYDLARIYVDSLGSLLSDARERFLPPPKPGFTR
jgi:hypothetical protein